MATTPRQPPSPEVQAAKLRAILDSAVTAIITIDDRRLIESINPATERLFGYSAAELMGRNVKVLMPEPYKAEHDGYIANYRDTGVKKIIGIGREVSGRRKDGTTFPLHLSISEFSQLAVMAAKETVNRAFEGGLADGVMFERRLFHALFATEDQKEGMDAFVNKRKAQFRNM